MCLYVCMFLKTAWGIKIRYKGWDVKKLTKNKKKTKQKSNQPGVRNKDIALPSYKNLCTPFTFFILSQRMVERYTLLMAIQLNNIPLIDDRLKLITCSKNIHLNLTICLSVSNQITVICVKEIIIRGCMGFKISKKSDNETQFLLWTLAYILFQYCWQQKFEIEKWQ